jgi:hypothetical protein
MPAAMNGKFVKMMMNFWSYDDGNYLIVMTDIGTVPTCPYRD